MDDFYSHTIESQILDFATDKRFIWEKKHQIYSVIFELTPKCNFDCVHCYLHEHHVSSQLSFERIKEIIDILYEKQVLFLTLTGGDIFTRSDFIDIYLYAKKKGFIIELYTNGSLINDEIIDVFRKYPPLLIDISLYGSNESTYQKVTGVCGAFDKVMENISKLISADIRVSLKAPILNLYYSELSEIKAIAEYFKVPFRTGFEIFPSVDNDNGVQKYAVSISDALKYEFKEFDKRPRTFGEDSEAEIVDLTKKRPLFRCKLGRASCAIDYEGKMCPCMSFRHIGQELTTNNFDELWQKFGEFPKMKASPSYRCLSCEAYDFCDICPAMMQFIHIAFYSEQVKSGGMFNKTIEDCLVMYHPEHRNDYFSFCIRVQKQGAMAFIAVNDFGSSKQMDKYARTEYAKQDRQGKDMSYKIGSLIGSGIRNLGKSKQKYEEEQNYYNALQSILDDVIS